MARSKNQGPFSGRRSSPQNGWTHYGSTRFAGCILVRKVVAVFWAHWQSVIDFFKVMVFLPVGVGIRCMLVRFGSRSDSCGPFCSMPFGDLRAYRRGPCSCLKHSWFFGFTYMQVRQVRKVQANHSSYFVRKAKRQIEIGDSNRV